MKMNWMTAMVDPDELCSICDKPRDMHGDMNHEFNTEGQLIQKKPRPEPDRKPPKHRDDEPDPKTDENSRALATLVEVLIEKNILDAKDVLRIFKGNG